MEQATNTTNDHNNHNNQDESTSPTQTTNIRTTSRRSNPLGRGVRRGGFAQYTWISEETIKKQRQMYDPQVLSQMSEGLRRAFRRGNEPAELYEVQNTSNTLDSSQSINIG